MSQLHAPWSQLQHHTNMSHTATRTVDTRKHVQECHIQSFSENKRVGIAQGFVCSSFVRKQGATTLGAISSEFGAVGQWHAFGHSSNMYA